LSRAAKPTHPASKPLQPTRRAQDNELRSADVALRVLTDAGLPPDTAGRAAELIVATASHLHGPDRDGHIVVDADLSVLGAALPRWVAGTLGGMGWRGLRGWGC
jgi:hypothetical protein